MTRTIALLAGLVAAAGLFWWLGSEAADPQPIPSSSDEPAVTAPESKAPSDPGSSDVADRSPGTREGASSVEPLRSLPDGPVLTGRILLGTSMESATPLTGGTLTLRSNRLPEDLVGRTDETGAFTIPFPENGVYALSIDHPAIAHRTSRDKIVRKTASSQDLGDLLFTPACSMTGRIVTKDGGPAVGARVHAYRESKQGAAPFDEQAAGHPGLPPGESSDFVTTDSEGRFEIGRLTWTEWGASIWVSHPTHGSKWHRVKIDPGATQDVGDLSLGEVERRFGRVVDEKLRPVEGALVFPGYPQRSYWDPSRKDRERAVVTDREGRFAVSGLDKQLGSEGTQSFDHNRFVVLAEGFPEAVVEIDRSLNEQQIQLRKPSVLFGTVTGAPPNAVSLDIDLDFDHDGPEAAFREMSESQRRLSTAKVDAEGRFRIVDPVTGGYTAQASAAGLGTSERVRFVVDEKGEIDPPLNLEIRRTPTCFVRVLDDLGRPIEGARATFRFFPPEDAGAEGRYAGFRRSRLNTSSSDAEGRLTLFLEGRTKTASITADGHLTAALDPADLSDSAELEVTLERTGSVHGKIWDPALVGRVNISVVLSRLHRDRDAAPRISEAWATVDAAGRFQLVGLAGGEYSVRFEIEDATDVVRADESPFQTDAAPLLGSGLTGTVVESITVTPGETTELELAPPRVGSISGHVLSASGPVAGAQVFALREKDDGIHRMEIYRDARESEREFRYHPHCLSDSEGEYEFLTLLPGKWKILVRHPDAPFTMPPVLVSLPEVGGRKTLDLRLATGSLRAEFVQPEDLAPELRIRSALLYPASNGPDRPVRHLGFGGAIPRESSMKSFPIENGRLEIPFLPAGDYLLVVYPRTYAMTRFVRVGEDELVDLGQITPEIRSVRVPVRSDGPIDFEFRLEPDGANKSAFVSNARSKEGFVEITLEPGRYEAVLRTLISPHPDVPDWLEPKQGSEQTIQLEVHSDGTVTPETIVYPPR